MSSCDKTKKFLTELELFDRLNIAESEKELKEFGKDYDDFKDVEKDIEDLDVEKISEDKFNEILNKRYGRHKDRTKYAMKILALMNANTSIGDMIKEEMLHSFPGDKSRITISKKGTPELSSYSLGSLKLLYSMALKMSNAGVGENWGKGLVGNLTIELRTTKGVAKLERTGAVYDMVDKMQRLSEKISFRINEFMFKPKSFKSKRDYGMNSILQDVAGLEDYLPYKDRKKIDHLQAKLVRLYTMINHNWIFYGEDGKLYIHKDYAYTGKEYATSGDKVFAFMNPVLLENYAPPGKEAGFYYIPMTEKMNEEMKKSVYKTDVINKEVIKYIKSEMPNSVKSIIIALQKGLPSLDQKQVKDMFYSDKHTETVEYKSLSKDEKRLVDKLYSIFEGMTMIEPIIFESSLFKEKKNYFPALYEKMSFPLLWDHLMATTESNIKAIKKSLKTLVGMDRIKAKDNLKKEYSVLNRGTYIRDRMDEYPSDMLNNITMPIAKDIKHIEHITNSIDIRNMRTDDGVYYTYLKSIMAAIERNYVTAQLIESYIKAKSDGARDYIEGIYKIPFNRPDTPGSFLGIDYSVKNMVSKLGKFGVMITPESLQRKLKIAASWLTGRYLSGFWTTAQNFFAINQNIIDYGWRVTIDAWNHYSANKSEWKNLINKSGIIEFQDFFSKALINEMAATEVGAKTYETIMGAYLNFYIERKNAGKNKKLLKKAEDNLTSNIDRALKESDLFITDPKGMPTEERIKKRLKIHKSKRRLQMMQKFVNYAINYEYEMNKSVKGWNMKNVPYKALGTLFREWGKVRQKFGLTMGATESFIRSISFIIGIREAQDMGYLPQIKPWEFDSQTLQSAIEIGRAYSRYTNFGLSTQDVGKFNWGAGGNMQGKFKFWSQQKFGRDVRIFKNAYTTLKSDESLEKDTFDRKALLKVLKTLTHKNLRDTDPEVAKMRTFIMGQGLATILFDTFLSPVAFIPHVRSYMYSYMPGGKLVRGVTSDFLSLFLMPFTLILKALFFDDDDEEAAIERGFSYYLRKTFMGFTGGYTFEAGLFLVSLLIDNAKMVKNKLTSLASPWLPSKSAEVLLRKSLDEVVD